MITEKEIFSHSDSQSIPSKTLYKFWSGLTKLLHHSLSQNQSVTFDALGTFSSSPPFTPSTSFTTFFAYPSSTLSPPSNTRISFSTLSHLCKLDLKTINVCQTIIFSRIKTQLRLGIIVRLNLKIGFLILQSSSFSFTPQRHTSPYHASNPNPVNDDSSNNLHNFMNEKILYTKVNLPPLTVQSKTTPTIVNKYSRKQFIEPYAPPHELLKINQNQSRRQQVTKTPEVTSLEELDKNNENRWKSIEADLRETEKINKSLVEYNNWKKSQARVKELQEGYSYFPFTEGDQIEEYRKKLNSQRREEFLTYTKKSGNINLADFGLKGKEFLLDSNLLAKRNCISALGIKL